jgi:hypothetical protein
MNNLGKRKRSEVLEAADAAINGPREDDYGSAGSSFQRTANLLNAAGFGRNDGPTIASDVAIIMVLLKIARLGNSPSHEDSWIDIAGYAALGAEVAEETA